MICLLFHCLWYRVGPKILRILNLTPSTKIAVYNAVCISILLHGCEVLVICRHHIKALEAFHIRCLQGILRLRWLHKVRTPPCSPPTSTPWSTSSCKDNCDGSAMSSECLPIVFPIMYCSESFFGDHDHRVARRSGSLIHIKATLKCHIPADELETLAEDGSTW